MSNLKTKFESKLTSVVKTVAKNGRLIYTASFEDGTNSVIRTSDNDYIAVAQVKTGSWVPTGDGNDHKVTFGPDTEFLFSRKPTPSMREFQRQHHVVTVQVTQ